MLDAPTILDRFPGGITFRVDDVSPAQAPLLNEPVEKQLSRQCERPFLVFSHDSTFEVVHAPARHPLINAVHFAFSEHRPLLLDPDIIWMTIAQGFAQHVNNNAERLRKQFVRHDGKMTLRAKTVDLSTADDWAEVVDIWSEETCRNVVADFESLLVCKFSTTTSIIRTASQVVMMDAFRQYFDFVVQFICGIPEITVRGTVEDWSEIRDRVSKLAKYDLRWWTKRLLPICDGFLETVKGRPSVDFWRQIYSPKEIYGGNVITGWLADLFPYLRDAVTKSPTVRNPILAKQRARLNSEDGISPDAFPVGLSQAPFILETFSTKHRLEIVGGFLGVTQDPETKYLKAEIGWAIREQDKFDAVLNELESFHKKGRPENWPVGDNGDAVAQGEVFRGFEPLPKDVIQISDRLGGGTIFGDGEHPWFVRPLDDHSEYQIAGRTRHVTHFMDLVDGRCVTCFLVYRVPWIMVGRPVVLPVQSVSNQTRVIKPEESIIVAKSFQEFFERMLQAKGRYYFDDPGFVPDDSLQDMSLELKKFFDEPDI